MNVNGFTAVSPRVDFQAESDELVISVWTTPITKSVFTLPKSGGVTNGMIPTLVTPIPLQESEGEIIMWGNSHTNYTKSLLVKRARLSVYKSHQRQHSWGFSSRYSWKL